MPNETIHMGHIQQKTCTHLPPILSTKRVFPFGSLLRGPKQLDVARVEMTRFAFQPAPWEENDPRSRESPFCFCLCPSRLKNVSLVL